MRCFSRWTRARAWEVPALTVSMSVSRQAWLWEDGAQAKSPVGKSATSPERKQGPCCGHHTHAHTCAQSLTLTLTHTRTLLLPVQLWSLWKALVRWVATAWVKKNATKGLTGLKPAALAQIFVFLFRDHPPPQPCPLPRPATLGTLFLALPDFSK